MKTWIYKNAKEEMAIINMLVAKNLASKIDKRHNPDGSGSFSTKPEFGTYLWAIQNAERISKNAYNSGKKAFTPAAQKIIDEIYTNGHGYVVMSESELDLANGFKPTNKCSKRKFIVCAELTLNKKNVVLLPLK